MRVAVSGAHRTGKTSLIERLAEQLPGYAVLEEPYRQLEDDGYEFSDPPSLEDYERQLRRSIETIRDARADALFDRCPLDFIAYIWAYNGAVDIDDDVRGAIQALDLIVVVPIEIPDRVAVPASEHKRLRRRVDSYVRRLVREDPLGFDPVAIDVSGSVDDRVGQVLRVMKIG